MALDNQPTGCGSSEDSTSFTNLGCIGQGGEAVRIDHVNGEVRLFCSETAKAQTSQGHSVAVARGAGGSWDPFSWDACEYSIGRSAVVCKQSHAV